ncbi:MAG: hypothetical protein QOJ98_1190 [Acidobacteriota bacterium]|jgi:hypothetical protein|nr:hypothetical protein [Acidobacteriota bacterium]
MSATSSGELTATTVIGLIEAGTYPRDVVATIARGFLPLSQQDLIGVLAYLALSDDAEIAQYARDSFSTELPARAIFEYASNEQIDPEHLSRLLRFTTDNMVLEALIRNRAVPDGVIAELARHAEPRVQEVIVINQTRILRAPEILDALLENPGLSGDARRRALETKEEFFEKRARLQLQEEAEEEELLDVPLDAIADLLEKAAEVANEPDVAPVPLMDSERTDPKKQSLWARVSFMTIAEKVKLAFRGDRTARMLLVRDRNRLVCAGVMRNPRMTEQEAEQIAGMRNVEEEVLRLVGMRRDWMSKYNIMLALLRNPKTPVGVVLPLINRLTLRDLKALKDDKGVQHVVRDLARKAYLLRTKKT